MDGTLGALTNANTELIQSLTFLGWMLFTRLSQTSDLFWSREKINWLLNYVGNKYSLVIESYLSCCYYSSIKRYGYKMLSLWLLLSGNVIIHKWAVKSFLEQKLRFGLLFGRLKKKIGPLWATFEGIFPKFLWAFFFYF